MEKVMDGNLADMVFTDPPYNVDYGNTAKDKIRKKAGRTILNDNLGEGFEQFLYDACVNLLSVCKGRSIRLHEFFRTRHPAIRVSQGRREVVNPLVSAK
jgi:hypothetical protein